MARGIPHSAAAAAALSASRLAIASRVWPSAARSAGMMLRLIRAAPRMPHFMSDVRSRHVGADGVVEDAEVAEFDLDPIAWLQEHLRIAVEADAIGGAGQDHVAGIEGDGARDEGDDLRHRKDHLAGVRRLARLAVDAAA